MMDCCDVLDGRMMGKGHTEKKDTADRRLITKKELSTYVTKAAEVAVNGEQSII